jgi:hypothetical protein
MKNVFIIAASACIFSISASAQDLGTSKSASDVDILSFDAQGGSAIIADRLGDKYACDVTQKRTYAEINGCKPIRLSARVGGYIEAQAKVLGLFERNDCALTYAQLKSALTNASEETRKAVGEIMADMTQSGALVDDEARGRARLTTGAVCSK